MADSQNTTSRRAILAGAAALPALAVPAALAASPADPIFAAIESHRAARREVSNALRERWRLEDALPKDRRRSFVDMYRELIHPDDDPRWIAIERRAIAASKRRDGIACEILDTPITTLEGVQCLLRYALQVDLEEDGIGWPEDITDDAIFPERLDGYSWHLFMLRQVTAAMETIRAA